MELSVSSGCLRVSAMQRRLEELMVLHGSPTMAGLKTGSLFNCPIEEPEMLTAGIRRLNRRLVSRGICLLLLQVTGTRALLYLYRPARLKVDLAHRTAERILAANGYPVGHVERCIVTLIRRLRGEESFPHEIGLFLGYPPEDVEAFIRNGAAGAKLVGTWKVYGDVEAAKCQFAQYKKCTKLYCRIFQQDYSLDRLIVG